MGLRTPAPLTLLGPFEDVSTQLGWTLSSQGPLSLPRALPLLGQRAEAHSVFVEGQQPSIGFAALAQR